jgi:hypothetical protein
LGGHPNFRQRWARCFRCALLRSALLKIPPLKYSELICRGLIIQANNLFL